MQLQRRLDKCRETQKRLKQHFGGHRCLNSPENTCNVLKLSITLRRHSRAANRDCDGANRALRLYWTKVPDKKVTILIEGTKRDSGYSRFCCKFRMRTARSKFRNRGEGMISTAPVRAWWLPNGASDGHFRFWKNTFSPQKFFPRYFLCEIDKYGEKNVIILY